MSDWLDIESAPKDGTNILVRGGDVPSPRVGWWGKNWHSEFEHWHVHEGTADNPSDFYLDFYPTQWFPIPVEPPDFTSRLAKCDSQNRAKVLVEALSYATNDEARSLLAKWFNACDAIGDNHEVLRRHFERARFVTDTDEKLELPATVYRACWEDDDPSIGLSWTKDLEVAIKFGKSFFGPRSRIVTGMYKEGKTVTIWKAECVKALGYLCDRNEQEVIPDMLINVEPIYTISGEKR